MYRQFTILSILLMLSAAADAQHLFRYKDESGRTVIRNSISGETALSGYDILDPMTGKVVEHVPATVVDESSSVIYATPDDEILLSSYSSVEEINAHLARKIDKLDAEVANIEADKRVIQVELEAELAERQKLIDREREIPEELQVHIEELEHSLQGLNAALARRETDRQQDTIEYESKAKRFAELQFADEVR